MSDSCLDPVALEDITGMTGKTEKVSEDWMAVTVSVLISKI